MLLLGSDLRGFWPVRLQLLRSVPGAERHMIYFGGEDVAIQRGHIYSLFVWPEDVPVKAQILKEKKKTKKLAEG